MIEEIEPTQDVPVAEAKAEGQGLEWGPDLGRMSWYDVQTKIAELNASLAEGEKSWRLPTKYELVAEFDKAGKTPTGFQSDYYLSDTTISDEIIAGFEKEGKIPADFQDEYYRISRTTDVGNVFIINMDNGFVSDHEKGVGYYVRLVRDAA